jgi:mRNA-degrading endonuclease RelE of RelBE toxin-antitoxin system
MYVVEWADQGKEEMLSMHPFHRGRVVSAVNELERNAETETRNRKRLRPGRDIPPEYPDPTWEIRIGEYRVLYGVDGETVTILRVKLKSRRTIGEIL